MCNWCEKEGYWECDGEGGDCGGANDDGDCVKKPHGGGWEIDCTRPLQDKDGNPVKNPHGKPVIVRIVGTCDQDGDNLVVKLNGKPVPHDKDDEPPKLPQYPDGRKRAWKINNVFQLEPGVPVRVQAYVYEYDSKLHKDPRHPTKGWGPNIRVLSVRGGNS